jgi:hypothetical protein
LRDDCHLKPPFLIYGHPSTTYSNERPPAGQILHVLAGWLLPPSCVTELLKVENFYANPLRRIGNPFYLRTAIRKHHHNASLYYIHQTERATVSAQPEQYLLV